MYGWLSWSQSHAGAGARSSEQVSKQWTLIEWYQQQVEWSCSPNTNLHSRFNVELSQYPDLGRWYDLIIFFLIFNRFHVNHICDDDDDNACRSVYIDLVFIFFLSFTRQSKNVFTAQKAWLFRLRLNKCHSSWGFKSISRQSTGLHKCFHFFSRS